LIKLNQADWLVLPGKIMRRRQFIKIGSAALLSTCLPFRLYSSETAKPVVWEIEGSPDKTIPKLFELMGGLSRFIQSDPGNATVLIKPNLCFPISSHPGATSTPEMIIALSEFLISGGTKRVIIADHTLNQSGEFSNTKLNLGIEKIKNAKIILTNQQRLYSRTEVDGKVLKSTETLKMLSKVDMVINLAAAKHHSACEVSLAIKNLMGLIWDRAEFHTRLDLSQAIADLATAIKPALNIIEAKNVLLNNGPVGPGPIVKDNRLFASTDILAVDSIVVSRYGFGGKSITPQTVPHLWAAYKNNIGEIDPEMIRVEKTAV
jgi:uncharacterized protein (DUF362 family)